MGGLSEVGDGQRIRQCFLGFLIVGGSSAATIAYFKSLVGVLKQGGGTAHLIEDVL